LTYNGDTLITTSNKYATVYPHDSSKDNNSILNIDTASQANYVLNTKIFGDAIRETSVAGTGSTSWYGDYSYFAGLDYPFLARGGSWSYGSSAGLFYFCRNDGYSSYSGSFRAVLVAL